MPVPVLIPGGRIFHPGPTHGAAGWPAGEVVFGRTRGGGMSIWSPPPGSASGVRCLPASPCYAGVCCPGDDALLAVTHTQPTWVYGAALGPCAPAVLYTGSCFCEIQAGTCAPCTPPPLAPAPVCAPCDGLSGGSSTNAGGSPGNVLSYGLGGLLGFYEMEVLGFSVHPHDTITALDGGWSGNAIPAFIGPDGVIFPSNSGAGSSHMSNEAGGHFWMGKYTDATDGAALYVMVVGGAYPVLGVVPGWASAMVTNGIGGLIQVFTQSLVPPPETPKIAFGHAANCNSYPPIDWGSGSFSAPGNGLLVGDPTKGVIPS